MIFHRLLLRGVDSMRVWRGGVESTRAWQRSGTRLATDSVARARSYHASFQLSQHGGKVFKLFSEALGRRQTHIHKVETETYNTGPRSLHVGKPWERRSAKLAFWLSPVMISLSSLSLGAAPLYTTAEAARSQFEVSPRVLCNPVAR